MIDRGIHTTLTQLNICEISCWDYPKMEQLWAVSLPAGTAHSGVRLFCEPWFLHTIVWKTASTQVVFLDSDYWEVLLEHELPYCLYKEMLQKIINNKYTDIYIFDVYLKRSCRDRRRFSNVDLSQVSSKLSIPHFLSEIKSWTPQPFRHLKRVSAS